MKALVRRPSLRLGDGIVTHISRTAVDLARAREQWASYISILVAAGWEIVEVPPADDCADGVFIEDALVVVGDLAVVTRPGAEARRAETEGLDGLMRELGYRTAHVKTPATLDGGDVLALDGRLLIGTAGRTNDEGAAQLAGLTGVPVETESVRGVLHLKTAKTALPDGTTIGANTLDLGGGKVLLAAGSQHVAEVSTRGFDPVEVDISEFEKLEAGVTCLSVLLRPTIR